MNGDNWDCGSSSQIEEDPVEKLEELELEINQESLDTEPLDIKTLGIKTTFTFLNTELAYQHLITEKSIDQLVSKLEKLEIIGENLLKYWEKDKVICKLAIKNHDYIIKTSNIEATNKDMEEFKLHITELLKLGVIRKSSSQHRSAAFIVNNHAEQVRGKSRMVINYKRLNDNTYDDMLIIYQIKLY